MVLNYKGKDLTKTEKYMPNSLQRIRQQENCDQAAGELAQLERKGRSHPVTAKAVNMKIQTA